jgi:hypothetical protein
LQQDKGRPTEELITVSSELTQPNPLARLMNDYATVNLDDWSTYDDPPNLILVVVVGTALVHVSLASVFLGLAGR